MKDRDEQSGAVAVFVALMAVVLMVVAALSVDLGNAWARGRSVQKQADLAAVRLSDLETQPLYHVASQLVYACNRQQVTDVWIAGRRKLAARELIGMDTAAILARTRAWRERIVAA